MKLHKFTNDYFHSGQVKYRAGQHYEPNDETTVAVAAGHAEEVEGDSALVSEPGHPRTRAERKAELLAIVGEEEARKARVAAAQKELDAIIATEEHEAAAKAAAAKKEPSHAIRSDADKANDKAQAAQDRSDARAEAKADRAAAERSR
jgi:hypothetical protein